MLRLWCVFCFLQDIKIGRADLRTDIFCKCNYRSSLLMMSSAIDILLTGVPFTPSECGTVLHLFKHPSKDCADFCPL